jgi:hypothetical protein
MPEYSTIRFGDLSVGWQSWRIQGPQIGLDLPGSYIGYSPLDGLLRTTISLHTYLREGYIWQTGAKGWDDLFVVFSGEPGEIITIGRAGGDD